MRIFYDRREAGQSLATHLSQRLEEMNVLNPIVLALPRGGLPVAFEISRLIQAPLDVLITRKIGAPQNPEYGIGAISEDGSFWINPRAVVETALDENTIQSIVKNEKAEIRRRTDRYRGGKPMIDVRGKTVLLVDDGLATGVTATVSVQALKRMGASRVIFAAPVCAADSVRELKKEADQVICLEEPEVFFSVGSWYQNFDQTTDEEVIDLLEKSRHRETTIHVKEIQISDGIIRLPGTLSVPARAFGVVLFAHGSGSSRLSPRNRQVAENLNRSGIATLLFDLLDPIEAMDREKVFDIPLLTSRLLLAHAAIQQRAETFELPVGFFGASTGAAAALSAAATLGDSVKAVVSRGGRPDLAMEKLGQVNAPTLLIVGGLDEAVISLNRQAQEALPNSQLSIIPGATHLFEEPGTLETASDLARDWFSLHLRAVPQVRVA